MAFETGRTEKMKNFSNTIYHWHVLCKLFLLLISAFLIIPDLTDSCTFTGADPWHDVPSKLIEMLSSGKLQVISFSSRPTNLYAYLKPDPYF